MHNMHTNRVSSENTSAALGNDAITRIKDGMEKAQVKRASKHQDMPEPTIKRIASKEVKSEQPVMVKIAGIHEIPQDFERIGTGFYRRGHHLWELTQSDGGFVLVRKHGEDHVLGYEPEPTNKAAPKGTVADRFGTLVKVGSKIKFPHRGKTASAIVVVVQPGALQVETPQGKQMGIPPDMAEVCSEEKPAQTVGEEFEPDIEPTSKADENEVAEQDEDEDEDEDEEHEQLKAARIASKKIAAEPKPQSRTDMPPEPPGKPTLPPVSIRSEIVTWLDGGANAVEATIPGSKYGFIVRKSGEGKYDIFTIESALDKFANYNQQQLVDWEMTLRRNTPNIEFRKAAFSIQAALNTIDNLVGDDLQTWSDFWHSMGQKIAGPLTEEQRQQRRQRRKELRDLKKGLPKGVKLPRGYGRPSDPSKPIKTSAKNTDDIARYKERLRLYEQAFDELNHVVSDESLRENEEQLVAEVNNVLSDYAQQFDELDDTHQEEMEDSLSIETPPEKEELTPTIEKPKTSGKISVSMSDLE